MPTIYIDNRPYEVKAGQNLLEACLSLKFDIPYFCWHPAMHSVGACRMCAIKQYKDENDSKGKLVMACMTAVSEGIRISIHDPEVLKFRKSVSEWLMINHPHDCPVCDEGGECHLQDMTQMTGQVYRRYRFRKRTFHNQYLGPFIRHEMNRCIQCYRCVRFYQDYAGGRDFGVFGWHDHVYFGRHEDGVLKSEFSGNLIEICPTGVFTDKTFAKHYTRKWDLQTAPSVCVHCGLGCNIIPAERYGALRRIHNRYNREVNGYFLCDRGRFGYEFVNAPGRIRKAVCRNNGKEAKTVSKEEAANETAQILKNSQGVIGIGSPRASIESNFALRALVGAENFYFGASETESRLVGEVIDILRNSPVETASLHDVETADGVLVIGEDLLNTAPMLGLAIRQSILRKPAALAEKLHIEEWNNAPFREVIQDIKGPLFMATVDETALDDAATITYRAAPGDLARLGFAVAHEINHDAPSITDADDEMLQTARGIAAGLCSVERPVIISGTSCGSREIIEACTNIAYALYAIGKKPQLCFTASNCNTLGLGLLGAKPIDGAIEAVKSGRVGAIVILENNVYRYLDAATADELFNLVNNIIVIDCIENATTAKARCVLPAAAFAEGSGTIINNEGRAQRFYKVYSPDGDNQEGWRWLENIRVALKVQPRVPVWTNLDAITEAIAKEIPDLEVLTSIAPKAEFRMVGQKIPRQPSRYSGRTAQTAHVDVHEPPPAEDEDSPLSFSMEGHPGQPPSSLICRYRVPKWNSLQSVNKYQREVGGLLYNGDSGRRVFEPKKAAKVTFFTGIPASFEARGQEFFVMPSYHIFGTEELSMLSPGIAELSAKTYIAINPENAKQMNLTEGGMVEVPLGGRIVKLSIKMSPYLAKGVALTPFGLPDLPWDGKPIYCKLTKC